MQFFIGGCHAQRGVIPGRHPKVANPESITLGR